MPFWALTALKWAGDNWKLVAAGLLALMLAIYIGVLKFEVSHYKGKYEEVSAELASAQKREDTLKAEVAGITEKYKSALVETKGTYEKYEATLQDNIQKDVELNTLRISYAAVGLFNQSKRDPSSPAAKAVKRDDGKASTADPTGTANGLGKTVTLAQVFAVVAKNDINHWRCVKQVETWQSFWTDYEGAVIRAGAQ
jgi:hypothetical protein